VSQPKKALIQGADILAPVLVPNGFHFVFRGKGRSSGGEFAWGEFVRAERKLELHFRNSLGLVRYHTGHQSASHEAYMREVGVFEHCQYPGFPDEAITSFRALAHDLSFAEDFLSGSAAVLQRAAAKEASAEAKREIELMSRYVGDSRKLEQLEAQFKQGNYGNVLVLASDLKYPDQMSKSERRMVEIA
jgi:hypothetical protein